MKPRILGWTEKHTAVAVAMAVSVSACLVGLLEPRPYQLPAAGAVLAVAVISLALDGFGGFLVGLAAGAALIGVKRVSGGWVSDGFWVSLVETIALVLAGATSGAAGTRLRPGAAARKVSSALDPVYGSLGLLSYDAALARLDDEVDRAVRHHRPLTLVRLSVEANGPEDGRGAALRAVARLLESRVRDSDVPFAVAPDDLGAILPETNAAAAWELVGALIDAVRDATYTIRGEDTRQQPLGGGVQLHFGMASSRGPGESADDLMDAATDALRRGVVGG